MESSSKKLKIEKCNVLVGVSGSVATIKVVTLCKEISKFANVRLVTTTNATHFFQKENLPADVELYTDADEWNEWQKMHDPVIHIELRRWAHVMLIAPLSANTLAKLANGLCDNLLTCVARAWDFSRPFIVAPAMNTFMWDHPFTAKHLKTLKDELGIIVIDPIAKNLACNEVGIGAMEEVGNIVPTVKEQCRIVLERLATADS